MTCKRTEVERSSPFQLTFSPSSLEAYLECARKYAFRSIIGLNHKARNAALGFGAAIHAGIGTYYTVRHMSRSDIAEFFKMSDQPAFGAKDTKALVLYLMVEAFREIWSEMGVGGDEKRSLESGIVILKKYMEVYWHDSSRYLPEYVETPLRMEMPNGTTLIMILDRVRKEESFITVVDTKTSTWSLTDFFFLNFTNSFQLSAYDYSVLNTLGHCDACQVDGIFVPWKEKGDMFVRRTLLRTDLQREDFVNTYLRATDAILSSINRDEPAEAVDLKKFPCNPTSCSKYGGCKYLPVCQHGFTHPSVQIDYERTVKSRN